MTPTQSTIVRSVLKVGGGFLVANGLADESTVEAIVGGLVTLMGIIWGIFKAKKAAQS